MERQIKNKFIKNKEDKNLLEILISFSENRIKNFLKEFKE